MACCCFLSRPSFRKQAQAAININTHNTRFVRRREAVGGLLRPRACLLACLLCLSRKRERNMQLSSSILCPFESKQPSKTWLELAKLPRLSFFLSFFLSPLRKGFDSPHFHWMLLASFPLLSVCWRWMPPSAWIFCLSLGVYTCIQPKAIKPLSSSSSTPDPFSHYHRSPCLLACLLGSRDREEASFYSHRVFWGSLICDKGDSLHEKTHMHAYIA